jgi:dCMP deaminase
MSQKWDVRFLNQALLNASYSKDTSTKVGCVIVGSAREIRTTGYNGMPRCVNDDVPERYLRPVKYAFFEHAERNAIYNAARVGIPLDGCTMYVVADKLQGPPCADCCRAAIQSGIKRVVCNGTTNPQDWREDWRESMLRSRDMLIEAGILFDLVPNEVIGIPA